MHGISHESLVRFLSPMGLLTDGEILYLEAFELLY